MWPSSGEGAWSDVTYGCLSGVLVTVHTAWLHADSNSFCFFHNPKRYRYKDNKLVLRKTTNLYDKSGNLPLRNINSSICKQNIHSVFSCLELYVFSQRGIFVLPTWQCHIMLEGHFHIYSSNSKQTGNLYSGNF